MLDVAITLAQIVLVIGAAAWLTIGVWDNVRYPENNRIFTSQVMSMERMRNDYPAEFARVAHRAIDNRAIQRVAFTVVVVAELVACLILWAGAVGLVMGLIGTAHAETGQALAILGAALFTAVWSGFLVVGNYFCYWFCHEAGQNTHYQMTIWGICILIFLVVS